MSKIITKKLSRSEFNNAVIEAEKFTPKLGIKKIDSCIYYSYIDKNHNIIKLICEDYVKTA